jgi:transposase
LDDVEEFVCEPYRHSGTGRPPRNPMGILKALIVKRFRNIPSDRQLYRHLWSDPELRRICDIEDYEKPYHPSQLTRFRQHVGPERLESLMENIVDKLRNAEVVKGEIVACAATFIKAYSRRDPKDDSRGYGDPDAARARL